MIDAVLSYHADPVSCGVTKFSQQLAKRLGVPSDHTGNVNMYKVPLLSVKFSESWAWDQWPGNGISIHKTYDLFLHDAPSEDVDVERSWLERARRVFAANAQIAERTKPKRPDVIPAWCPSLVEAPPAEPVTVFSFGMATKIRTDLYDTLKTKLEASGDPYVVYVSAALHEGTTFSDARTAFDELRRLFGTHFVFLGTLSDEAMVSRLRSCTYVAAFFEHGLRENNTSVHAAVEHGATVVTNWDRHTPHVLQCVTRSIDQPLPHVARRGHLHSVYSWERLVALINAA